MNNDYLQDLIRQVQTEQGGIMLSVSGKTEAVVLSIDRYNQLLLKSHPVNSGAKRSVLVTGGAGYIGSHVVRQLVAAGHTVIVADDLSTGKKQNVPEAATLVEIDIRDVEGIKRLLTDNSVDVVIHMAASIEVEESMRKPAEYLHNNALATAMLLQAMDACGVKDIIFSSTAAVYGTAAMVPIPEPTRAMPNNPYGASKYIAEQLINYYAEYKGFKTVIFRYFNACGTDFDGLIQSVHTTHLISVLMDVVSGNKDGITVNGDDYDTFDGTCVRDYVHVLDIAAAHMLALEKIRELPDAVNVFNIGTGKGYSVSNIIQATAEITERMVPVEMGGRRPGDAASTIADNNKIKSLLGFEPLYSDLETIIKTSWNAAKRT